MPGEKKLKTTVLLTAGPYGVRVEAFVCRHADENHEAVYRYLLKRDIAAQLPSCLEDIFAGMTDPKKTLEVRHNRTTSEIPLDQIYYLESDLRQINVYGDIPHQPICTFYGKIADLPAMLYENGFLQVGRSDVVNLQYVRSICNYKVELRSGVELSVSRQYYTAIRSAWLEWKGQFGDE